MEKKTESTFTRSVPKVDNIYEMVVVAALRARQLNDVQRFRDPDQSRKIIDRALNEAFDDAIEYDGSKPPDGDESAEEPKGE
ncbi:MAG: DNA-directed RNA polymerase subunit omega [Candidatus Eisenbacteria bacterium]|nr:DNA-directed RNA polymerase subunit omega [Candidatus Eisenbacteria bacterium]